MTAITLADLVPSGGVPGHVAGPLGLVVIVLLCVAVAFLARSLAKHLGRVPASFDPPPAPESQPGRQVIDAPPPARRTPNDQSGGDEPGHDPGR